MLSKFKLKIFFDIVYILHYLTNLNKVHPSEILTNLLLDKLMDCAVIKLLEKTYRQNVTNHSISI